MDRDLKSRFLRGSVAATTGTVSSMAFHFLSIMILSRQLSKEEFGIYILLLVLVNLFTIVGGLGLDLTLVKFISSENQDENRTALRAVMTIRAVHLILLSIVFYAASSYLLSFFDSRLYYFRAWIPILFVLTSFRDIFFNLLQGLNLYKKFAVVQTISAAFRVFAILAFLHLNALSLHNLIFIEIFTTFTSVVVQLLIVPFRDLIKARPTKQAYAGVLKFSLPVYMNNILTFSYDRLSVFIIGALLNPLSVALFGIASKIPEAFQRMFLSFTIVFFPNQSKLFSQKRNDAAIELMENSLNILSSGLIAITLFSFLFREEIIRLLFSAKYIDSSLAFALLMFNFYLRAMSNIMGYSLVAAGHPTIPVKVNAVSSIINLSGGLLMIPRFGFTGAVYALLLMNAISQVIYQVYLFRKQIHPKSVNFLRPVIILAFLAGAYTILGIDHLIIKAAILAAYPVLGWFFDTGSRKLLSLFFNMVAHYAAKFKKTSVQWKQP